MIGIASNSDDLSKRLNDVAARQLPYAAMRTVNDLAFGIRADLQSQFRASFDKPTPFTLRSIIVNKATRQAPSAFVGLNTDNREDEILGHHFTGGKRAWKRMEGRLKYAGILKPGLIAVPGGGAALNAYGNIRPGLVTRILSYFDTLGKGYDMGTKGRAKLGRRGKTKDGYSTTRGTEYFVSFGKGNGGRRSRQFQFDSWQQHLPAGIWSRKGIHGSEVAPVLMFVEPGTYRKRFDLKRTAEKIIERDGPSLLAKHLANAIKTARI